MCGWIETRRCIPIYINSSAIMIRAETDCRCDGVVHRSQSMSETGRPARDLEPLSHWPDDVLATIMGFTFHQYTLADPLESSFERVRLRIPRIRRMSDTHKNVFSQVCERY